MWQKRLAKAVGCTAFAITMAFAVAPPLHAQDRASEARAATTDSGQASSSQTDATVQAISTLRSEFATLHFLTYLAVAVAVAVGIYVYVWCRRRFAPFATLKGASCTALAAVALLTAAHWSTLSANDGAACSSAVLEAGNRQVRDNDEAAARARDYDMACRHAREQSANAFGVIGIFRALFVPSDVPASAGLVKILAGISTLLMSLLLYFAFRPVALRIWVRA